MHGMFLPKINCYIYLWKLRFWKLGSISFASFENFQLPSGCIPSQIRPPRGWRGSNPGWMYKRQKGSVSPLPPSFRLLRKPPIQVGPSRITSFLFKNLSPSPVRRLTRVEFHDSSSPSLSREGKYRFSTYSHQKNSRP